MQKTIEILNKRPQWDYHQGKVAITAKNGNGKQFGIIMDYSDGTISWAGDRGEFSYEDIISNEKVFSTFEELKDTYVEYLERKNRIKEKEVRFKNLKV